MDTDSPQVSPVEVTEPAQASETLRKAVAKKPKAKKKKAVSPITAHTHVNVNVSVKPESKSKESSMGTVLLNSADLDMIRLKGAR